MLAYRIVYHAFSNSLSASGVEGRWNSGGKEVIYAGASLEIAFLENMVRRKGAGFNTDYKTMVLDIPGTLRVTEINLAELKPGWRDTTGYPQCQLLGDAWFDAGETAILKVPSAILTEASIYVLNTTHVDYKKIKLVAVTPLIPDDRIEDLLKNYKKR